MRKLGRDGQRRQLSVGSCVGSPTGRPTAGWVYWSALRRDLGHTQTWESSACGRYLKPCEWAQSPKEQILAEKDRC